MLTWQGYWSHRPAPDKFQSAGASHAVANQLPPNCVAGICGNSVACLDRLDAINRCPSCFCRELWFQKGEGQIHRTSIALSLCQLLVGWCHDHEVPLPNKIAHGSCLQAGHSCFGLHQLTLSESKRAKARSVASLRLLLWICPDYLRRLLSTRCRPFEGTRYGDLICKRGAPNTEHLKHMNSSRIEVKCHQLQLLKRSPIPGHHG